MGLEIVYNSTKLIEVVGNEKAASCSRISYMMEKSRAELLGIINGETLNMCLWVN